MPDYDALMQELLAPQQPAALPTMPRVGRDDGYRPTWTGLLGEALSGGQSPDYRLAGSERSLAGNRALMNFGLNMLMASGPQPVRPDLGSVFGAGLQGAMQSMDTSQQRAQQAATQQFNQRLALSKLGIEQDRDRIERLKMLIPLLQLQGRPVINPDGSVSSGGTTTGGGTSTAFTGDKAKDLALIRQRESGGDYGSLNYVAREDPTAYDRGATASGAYQIVNSTWKEGAALAGVDVSQYPTARSAPPAVQDQVASALYDKYGTKPWQKGAQDWVKDEQGKYQLAAVRPPAGAPGGPPGAVRTQVAAITPTTATDATLAPVVPSQQPPAPAQQPPAPAATTGPLANLPKMDDFVQQNMAKPTPDEEASWHTPLSDQEEKSLRDGLKRIQSSVDAARASYNAVGSKDSEGAYHTAQKAYSDAEAELAKRQREALKVGDDRKAKWFEGERTRLREIYGELVKGNVQIQTADNAAANTRKTKALEGLDADIKTAGDKLATFDALRILSQQVNGPSQISAIQVQGIPLVDILAGAKWGTPEQLRNYGVIQAYQAAAQGAVKEAAAGLSMGVVSDKDLVFLQNMIPRLSQDTFTREIGLSMLQAGLERKRDIATRASAYIAGGDTPAEAFRKAQAEAPKIIADVPKDVLTMPSSQRVGWFQENVRPGQAFRWPAGTRDANGNDQSGKVDIYFGDQPAPPGWTNLSDLKMPPPDKNRR